MPRWITVAGLEFGTDKPGFSNESPGQLGTDYFLNRQRTFDALARANFEGFRIPFRWERIQPILGGPLDPDSVQHLRLLLTLAQKFGAKVLLDLHNFGSYTKVIDGVPTSCALESDTSGQVELDAEDFADLWARIAYAMSGLPGVAGYALMNQPHDLPDGSWVHASQAAVDAIRSEGDRTPVYVAGESWSRSSDWKSANPSAPWIADPLNRVIYEAHCFLDQDGTGEYRQTYAEELAADPKLKDRSRTRLKPFLSWLKEGKATGLIGKFGVPSNDQDWSALLSSMLVDLDEANVQSIWWAAGEQWGTHPLSLQPGRASDTPPPAYVELFRD
ncbi:MAG: cellulase family glycosylhydrolase [Planctomycetota bacterium]|nr:cellulase family glycosylhydrolase [Planctomycetota bacterium]